MKRLTACFLLLPSCSFWQMAVSTSAYPQALPPVSTSGKRHPALGTSITHFTQVDQSVYAGSKPKSDTDFEFLRSKGIRYILEAKFLPFFTGPEKAKASRYGIEFLSVPMNSSPVPPSQKHVDQALRIMRTRQPIYVHCVLGRDRTSLLVGLYRMYFPGVSQHRVWEEMKQAGFRDIPLLIGLKQYFNKHTTPPPDLADLARR